MPLPVPPQTRAGETSWRKVTAFGLLGLAGCLAAWALGEGLLAATTVEQQAKSASLLSAPTSGSAPAAPPPPLTVEPPPRAPPPPPPPELARRLEREHAEAGDVEISLAWQNYNDLDLHCVDPTGVEIYFGNEKSPSGGWLDVDMNVGGPGRSHSSDSPIEHIRWPVGAVPMGRYRVYVNHYSRHGGANQIPYTVDLLANGERRQFTGTIAAGDKRLVCEFKVGPVLRMALPAELALHTGGANLLTVRVARDDCTGPVAVKFLGDLAGLGFGTQPQTLQGATIPADQSAVEIAVTADQTASTGSRQLQVVADIGGARAEGTLPLTVIPIPPSLQLAVQPELHLARGRKGTLDLRIARGHFDGPVHVRLSADVEGISAADLVIPPGQTTGAIAVNAGRAVLAGPREILVMATGGATKAEARFQLTVPPAVSWRELLVTAAWTGLLALGLSLALVMGQNRYLGRALLSASEAPLVLGGAIAAGSVAGGIGYTLCALLSQFPTAGFLAGWLLLGGLLGCGIGFFIPNLKMHRATAAGALGGTLGALPFLVLAGGSADVLGRFLSAALLGAAIGLMLAFVEIAFRQAWLEVRLGAKEVITVSLGDMPVKIGSDGRACQVYARGAAPLAFQYRLEEGRVVCVDYATEKSTVVEPGTEKTIGSVTVTVRASRQGRQTHASGTPAVIVGAPPPPPARKLPPAPAPAARVADGQPRVAIPAPEPRPRVPAPPPPVAKPRSQPSSQATPSESKAVRLPPPPPPKKKS